MISNITTSSSDSQGYDHTVISDSSSEQSARTDLADLFTQLEEITDIIQYQEEVTLLINLAIELEPTAITLAQMLCCIKVDQLIREEVDYSLNSNEPPQKTTILHYMLDKLCIASVDSYIYDYAGEIVAVGSHYKALYLTESAMAKKFQSQWVNAGQATLWKRKTVFLNKSKKLKAFIRQSIVDRAFDAQQTHYVNGVVKLILNLVSSRNSDEYINSDATVLHIVVRELLSACNVDIQDNLAYRLSLLSQHGVTEAILDIEMQVAKADMIAYAMQIVRALSIVNCSALELETQLLSSVREQFGLEIEPFDLQQNDENFKEAFWLVVRAFYCKEALDRNEDYFVWIGNKQYSLDTMQRIDFQVNTGRVNQNGPETCIKSICKKNRATMLKLRWIEFEQNGR